MTDAETAFAAAEAEIARVAAAGETELSLSGAVFRALEVVPETITALTNLQDLSLRYTQVTNLVPISALSNLQSLSLTNTQVTDLTPIAALTNLQTLYLDHTQVTNLAPLAHLFNLQRLTLDNTQVNDIAPLAVLSNLQTLWLDSTQIVDITPLADLSNLQSVTLDNTQVNDIAPLANHPALYEMFFDTTPIADLRPLLSILGLEARDSREVRFKGTEAVRHDPELARLAEIEDYKDRTDQTLAYLKTLPEWPAPLGGEAAEKSTPDTTTEVSEPPEKPSPRPAPLRVAFVDGKLREIGGETGLAEDMAEREALGRAALAEYLNSFEDAQLARIENALPRLGKALGQLQTTLDAGEAFNPIAAGMQGERVIRLSQGATDRLMDDDGEDVAHFAVEVARYLDRFLMWDAYKNDATPELVPLEEIRSVLPEFEAVTGSLQQTDWTADEIKQSYEVLFTDFRDDPDNVLAAKGLDDATREVLYAVGEEVVSQAKPLKENGELAKFKETYADEMTKGLAKDAARATRWTLYTSGSGVLVWVIANSSFLIPLASRFPYLKQVLHYLGLM